MSGKEANHGSPALTSDYSFQQHDDDPEDLETTDRVKLSSDTTRYTNSGHWTSILDGISELREHLDEIPASAHSKDDDQGDITGPDLLFSRQQHATKQELLDALPPRDEIDQLIATYFVSMGGTLATVLLHKPTFLREYNDFWCQPFEVSTMWLGLLFAVLALGARFRAESESRLSDSQNTRQLLYSAHMNFYREKVVQCLTLAKYTQCPPYTIETLLLYFATENLRSLDTQFSMWILVGMIVRIAFRMGYHREPSRFANISPFKAEMRRRIWLVIVSIDLVTSSQVGLPRMVQPFMYDTHEPGNFFEDDIHEYLTETPPSRPEVEVTPLLYTLVQTRVMDAYAKIMDLVNTNSLPAYREIMTLDARLRQVYEKVPPSVKPIPVEEFDVAITPDSMRRLYICMAFLKANLMLHRSYLLLGRTDSRYEYSRRACLNAALDMLAFQKKIHKNIQPGGQLASVPAYNFMVSIYTSPILNHEFLLATTVLVLDLDRDVVLPVQPSEPIVSDYPYDRNLPTQEIIINSLQTAYEIWRTTSKRSHEARKVVAAMRIVLRKANISAGQTIKQSEGSITAEQFVSPEFSFESSVAASDPGFLDMEKRSYADQYIMDSIPMDLGGFSSAFNWGTVPSEFEISLYSQFSEQPAME